jgi:hypothetical protein
MRQDGGMNEDTVKVHINIEILVDGTYDTGMTVAEWNALTPAERSDIVQDMKDTAMEADNGGAWVETDGAAEV